MMVEKQVSFYSEGYRLSGTFYYPDNLQKGDVRPAIIPASGYQGVNKFYPRLFAKYLTKKGYICLGFDYRGFADSEGEKGRVHVRDQVEDIQHALTFLQLQKNVDVERIGLIGWGMGASNVIEVAAKNKNVAAVAALNGFYDGKRWLKSVHAYKDWIDIVETLEEDRILRVTKGKSALADPFIHYPLDPATADYVQKELAHVEGFGEQTRLSFTDSIIDMNVESVVANVSPAPLFIGHGVNNILHPYDEACHLERAAAEPRTFYQIRGKHNDFMYEGHPEFHRLVEALHQFFTRSFKAGKLSTQSFG
ncbi:alpha/beta hydrolase [Texcoconibacillus texcoconensis]|uniref:Serine aminopeptidase S33 domain-containing protein n=1 Tax=Texcoconibacillus texcoconensis TaxID=1095777 RepID=A0A840QM00_9BACI|nr:alpha/beta fold hydrolase [Texcoconibacillus texcoconensis]MBB5172376.1 hypothetical protein [Texcoconibacillus texcoconensis]